MMKRFFNGWVILLVAAAGIWGCTQSSSGGGNGTEKIKTLEGTLNKMEDENKAVTAARDQLRKKLAEAEEERIQLEQQLQGLGKEREEMKAQLTARTAERDNLQTQFEQIRKALRGVLTQVDAVSNSMRPVTTSTSAQGKM
jgi:septal ring factor EnvC (AmiA/AmiB activator)